MIQRLSKDRRIVGYLLDSEWYLTMSAKTWSRNVIEYDDSVRLATAPLGIEALPFESYNLEKEL